MDEIKLRANLDSMTSLLERELLEILKTASWKSCSIDSDLVSWVEIHARCNDAINRVKMIRKAFVDNAF